MTRRLTSLTRTTLGARSASELMQSASLQVCQTLPGLPRLEPSGRLAGLLLMLNLVSRCDPFQ